MNKTPAAASQTRSFTTIFLIEMWERFGFYGMQALIVYYMVQRLEFPDERATLVWGAAAALIYVAPAIGGWIGIPAILGGGKVFFVGNALVDLFLQSRNWPFGSAIAISLVIIMLLLYLNFRKLSEVMTSRAIVFGAQRLVNALILIALVL